MRGSAVLQLFALDLPRDECSQVYLFWRKVESESCSSKMAQLTFGNYDLRISDERVGEWGLVKKMSVPAHISQSFDRINTFLAIIYDCFCPYAFCLAIFAA